MKIHGLYQRLDDALMYGANQLVHAWNWTTGRTRADLATGILLSGALFDITSEITKGRYEIPLLATFICAPTIWINHLTNKRIDAAEERASEQGALDLVAESYKTTFKISGPVAVVSGAMINCSTKGDDYIYLFSCGASWYILRADNPPRRKDVVRRTVDKLKEKCSRKPALALAPAMYTLEERL